MPDYEKMTDRELDALVAERVMGWRYSNGIEIGWTKPDGEWACEDDTTPPFSTDISAAWSVVEKMQADGWHYRIEAMQGGRTLCVFGNDLRQVVADSPGRAICECALRALDAQAGGA